MRVVKQSEMYDFQRILINLHPNDAQELHYCPFAVKLDICVESCNTLNDLSNKLCVPSKTEDLNLSVFNMISEINELKTLTKHVSWERKCKFDGRKYNLNQKWNNDKCWCECKQHHTCEKDYTWSPTICSCENDKYLANIMDDWVITCDEIIDAEAKLYNKETKLFQQMLMKKRYSAKHKIYIFYLHFY